MIAEAKFWVLGGSYIIFFTLMQVWKFSLKLYIFLDNQKYPNLDI